MRQQRDLDDVRHQPDPVGRRIRLGVVAATMSKRGTAILTAYQAQLEADRLAQHVTERCAWCPDWTAVATLAETRELARKHRRAKHPQIKERKHRSRPGLPVISRKTVGENIAGVRAQGGARWDGAA